MCGFTGPVVMTYPTKAVCPILLEDFRKITVERKGETNFFSSQMIKECMKRVIAVNIHQTVKLGEDIEVTAYYAGHVLGAAMFHVKVGQFSCLYTGDYNMTPDRHLGAAHIDKLKVDLLITETTYATTIRDSKRLREREFLNKVHDAVANGGKVLIPVFALGRAQELCILIETYWERMNLGHVPVYFSAGLVEKANLYYKLFINWTNQKIKETFVKHNMFDFKHIKPFDRAFADKPGPMVLFATPGMLHAGMSLEVFRKWCGSELNMCILPGYCVAGTVGNKILSGSKRVEIDKKTTVDVRLQVRSMSFSAHADAKGIMQLIQQCEPKNVMLVHGEKGKMQFLKERIKNEFGIPCFDPANGEVLTINLTPSVPVDISRSLLSRLSSENSEPAFKKIKSNGDEPNLYPRLDSVQTVKALLVIDNLNPVLPSSAMDVSSKMPLSSTSPPPLPLSSTSPPPMMSVDQGTSSASSSATTSPSPTTPTLRLVHADDSRSVQGPPEHTLAFEVDRPMVPLDLDTFFGTLTKHLLGSSMRPSALASASPKAFHWKSIIIDHLPEGPQSLRISWSYQVRLETISIHFFGLLTCILLGHFLFHSFHTCL